MSVSDNSTIAVSHDDGAVSTVSAAKKSPFVFSSFRNFSSSFDSPYVESEIVTLNVGNSPTRFLVHSSVLRKSAPLFVLARKKQPVSLPQLSETTAHTLVHHLYTGTFEVIPHVTPFRMFRQATCAYCAAVQYQLPSLADLSKTKVVDVGEGLPIIDVLKIARDDAFPNLPENDQWYSAYLEDVIQKAVSKDPEPFRRPDFITQVDGNTRLLQIVWRTVMSTAIPGSVPADRHLDEGAETPLADSLLAESDVPTQDSSHQLPSPTDSVVHSPRPPRETDDLKELEEVSLVVSARANDLSSDEVSSEDLANPVVQGKHTLDSDYGLPAIEPITPAPEPPKTFSTAPEAIKAPSHVRADSVVEEDAVAPDNSLADAKPANSNGTPDAGKKQKKKGKKRHTSITF